MRIARKILCRGGYHGQESRFAMGEGPRLYRDAVDENNIFYREWVIDEKITAALQQTDYLTQMHRCLIDLCHLEGFG